MLAQKLDWQYSRAYFQVDVTYILILALYSEAGVLTLVRLVRLELLERLKLS